MKAKYAIIILIIGFVLSFIGAFFKLMHWPYASMLLGIATCLEVIGAVIFLYKLVTYPKLKDFLNK